MSSSLSRQMAWQSLAVAAIIKSWIAAPTRRKTASRPNNDCSQVWLFCGHTVLTLLGCVFWTALATKCIIYWESQNECMSQWVILESNSCLASSKELWSTSTGHTQWKVTLVSIFTDSPNLSHTRMDVCRPLLIWRVLRKVPSCSHTFITSYLRVTGCEFGFHQFFYVLWTMSKDSLTLRATTDESISIPLINIPSFLCLFTLSTDY